MVPFDNDQDVLVLQTPNALCCASGSVAAPTPTQIPSSESLFTPPYARAHAAWPASTSISLMADDIISSLGTADSTSTHGDLSSTLRWLESTPAPPDSGLPPNGLLPRPDNQLLGDVCGFHPFIVYAHSLIHRASIRQSRHYDHSFHSPMYLLQSSMTRTAARTLITHRTHVLNRKCRLPPVITPPSPPYLSLSHRHCRRRHHHLLRSITPHLDPLLYLSQTTLFRLSLCQHEKRVRLRL